jgi:uncharacterized protein (TIGR02246 family)
MKKVILLGLLFLGLTTYGQTDKKDLKADEQAVRDISKKWLEFEKKNDLAGIAALFAADGSLYRTGYEPAVGQDAIKKQLTKLHELNPKEEGDFSTDRVDVAASGDMAVEYGKYSVKNAGADGKDTDQGKYVTVYKKVNGAWKVFADISSSSKPKQ